MALSLYLFLSSPAVTLTGEILETLWWPIDKVAGIAWAMSKAHRQEVLDDNMYDSN